MDLELAGKRAIVTGGGAGIGRAIAVELAREGVSVAVVSRRKEVLDDAARLIQDETGTAALPVVADTGDDSSVQSMVDTVVDRFGGVDILVNVASQNPAQPGGLDYLHAHSDRFLDQLNVKVVGYLRTAKAVAPHFIAQRWGRIINIAGIGARETVAVINSVRNVGVTALSKNLADELGPHGVNVTTLYPSYTLSNTYRERLQAQADAAGITLDQHLATIDTGNAIARFVQPHEIGWVAAFLASPKSVTINGDAITVCGGHLGPIHY